MQQNEKSCNPFRTFVPRRIAGEAQSPHARAVDASLTGATRNLREHGHHA
jgi:hypothetical protein